MSALYLLARAAVEGGVDAVVPAAAILDPLRRGSMRKRARRAYLKASELTEAAGVTDEAHALRFAFLQELLGSKLTLAPGDVAGVKADFDARARMFPKKKRAFWPVTTPLLLGVLLAAVIASIAIWFPTKRDRFASSPMGKTMTEGLTEFCVGVDHRDRDRMDKGRRAASGLLVKWQIGDKAQELLQDGMEQAHDLREAEYPDADPARERVQRTLHELSRELEERRVPAFIDEYDENGSSGSIVGLLGYYLEARDSVVVGNETVRFVWGRRLDTLNLVASGRTYRSAALDGVVVSLDDVEHWSIRNLAPAFGKGAGFGFGDEPVTETGSEQRFQARVGQRMRLELLGRMSEDDAAELSELLAKRTASFSRLQLLGDGLGAPRTLRMSAELKRALKKRPGEIDAIEARHVQDQLDGFATDFDAVVMKQADIEELRFAMWTEGDHAARSFQVDPELAASVGEARAGAVSISLAAELGTIARAANPYTATAEAASDQGLGGRLVLFLLERELWLAPTWLGRYGIHDQTEYAQLGAELFDKPADVIRKAAETAYSKIFGAPVPAFERRRQ